MRFKFLTLTVSLFTICFSSDVSAGDDAEDLYDLRKKAGFEHYRHKECRRKSSRSFADEKGYFADDEKSMDSAGSTPGYISIGKRSFESAEDDVLLPTTLPFKVFPVEFPEGIRLPKVTTRGIGRGRTQELLEFSLILANGQRYRFGMDGEDFLHSDPFESLGNTSPYHFSLSVKDNTRAFRADIPSFLHKKHGNQTLSRVRLDRCRDVTEPTIYIRYNLESRTFVAEGKVPWDWAREGHKKG